MPMTVALSQTSLSRRSTTHSARPSRTSPPQTRRVATPPHLTPRRARVAKVDISCRVPDEPVAVVTGGTAGIGRAVTQGLLQRGYHIVAVARSLERAERLEALRRECPSGSLEVRLADLALTREARRVAAAIAVEHPRIDLLVNSLGVFKPRREVTDEGIELNWAVNALAPWIMARELSANLDTADDPRVVQLSSEGHKGTLFSPARIDLGDLQTERGYDWLKSYGVAKKAGLLLNFELDRRLHAAGARVKVNNIHPGFVDTELGRELPSMGPLYAVATKLHARMSISSEQAAEPILRLATEGQYAAVSGAYFDKGRLDRKVDAATYDRDGSLKQRLWDVCSDMSGLPRDFEFGETHPSA